MARIVRVTSLLLAVVAVINARPFKEKQYFDYGEQDSFNQPDELDETNFSDLRNSLEDLSEIVSKAEIEAKQQDESYKYQPAGPKQPNEEPAVLRQCGSTSYNPYTQGCCYLSGVYNKTYQQCCGGLITSKGITCYACGFQTYNPRLEGCCGGRYIYKKKYKVCCEGRAILKTSPTNPC